MFYIYTVYYIMNQIHLENRNMLSRREKPTFQLRTLIDTYHSGRINLNDFKRTAMILARTDGIDFSAREGYSADTTLLHVFVSSNKDGINDIEIAELLALDSF